MMLRRAMILATAAVACGVGGCCLQQEMVLQLREPGNAVGRLLLAVEAYRAGAGRWPESPAQLRASSPAVAEAVGFDRFENLRFEPLPNGSLAVRFDRWAGEDEGGGTAWAGNFATELEPPDAAP